MNPWQDYPVPPMRHEAWDGDRIVRAFTPRPASFFALFENACASDPQTDAIVCEGQRWSYAQARAEALRYAALFSAQGLRQGDRLILFLGNRPEFLFVLLGAQYLGLITVPVGVREQRPGLAYIANQCEARAIVFDTELSERIPDATEAAALQHRWSAKRWRHNCPPRPTHRRPPRQGKKTCPASSTPQAPPATPRAPC